MMRSSQIKKKSAARLCVASLLVFFASLIISAAASGAEILKLGVERSQAGDTGIVWFKFVDGTYRTSRDCALKRRYTQNLPSASFVNGLEQDGHELLDVTLTPVSVDLIEGTFTRNQGGVFSAKQVDLVYSVRAHKSVEGVTFCPSHFPDRPESERVSYVSEDDMVGTIKVSFRSGEPNRTCSRVVYRVEKLESSLPDALSAVIITGSCGGVGSGCGGDGIDCRVDMVFIARTDLVPDPTDVCGQTTGGIELNVCLSVTDGKVVQEVFPGTDNRDFDLLTLGESIDAFVLPVGRISGQLKPDPSLLFLEEIGIQRATINLIQQPGFVRTTRKPGESDLSFQEYLTEQDQIAPIQRKHLTPDFKGRFSFDNLPLFEKVTLSGTTSFVPIYYALRVTNALSESEFVETDPVTLEEVKKMETSFFRNEVLRNLKADRTLPFTQHSIELTLSVAVEAKLELANQLSAEPTENNYKPIEQDVITFINDRLAQTADLTEKELEGLRRGVLAEMVVENGAFFADALLNIMLKGVVAVMADAYDELVTHISKGKSVTDQKVKKVEENISKVTFSDWNLDPNVMENVRNMNNSLDGLNQRIKEADFLDDVLINGIKVLSPILQIALEKTKLFEPGTPEKIVKMIQEKLIIALKAIKGGALNGFSKGSIAKGGLTKAAKILIPIIVKSTKPVLLDNTVLPSYTKITAPLLRHSVDRMIKWNQEGREPNQIDYELDQKIVVDVLRQINNRATRDIINAQYVLGSVGKLIDLALLGRCHDGTI